MIAISNQIEHENYLLKSGLAFSLVKKFLTLNQNNGLVEIILLFRNNADTGLQIFNSIQYDHIKITRAAFIGAQSPYKYIEAFKAYIFLSTESRRLIQKTNPED